MVNLSTVIEYNAYVTQNDQQDGRVCVFAGATSGIGAATLESLARILKRPVFYVIGRSATRFASQQAKLQCLNPQSKIVFLEAEFSMLSHVDNVCEHIIAAESKVDFLYMSPGRIPLNGAECMSLRCPGTTMTSADFFYPDTEEGLEVSFAISYYCRMRLLSNLLVLLRQSSNPRVLNVLNGGKEQSLICDDLGLSRHWSALAMVNHSTTMTTLALQYLAEHNPNITFIHHYPGWVMTENFSSIVAPQSSGTFWKLILNLVKGVAKSLAYCFGTLAEASGERQAFHLIHSQYEPGIWRLNHASEKCPAKHLLDQYIITQQHKLVWEHTWVTFQKCSEQQV